LVEPSGFADIAIGEGDGLIEASKRPRWSRVDHGHQVGRRYGVSSDPANHVLAIRRDIQVVYAAPYRDGLDVLKRGGVNHVDAAVRLGLICGKCDTSSQVALIAT